MNPKKRSKNEGSPDFGRMADLWDGRDKLGGFCVVCGVEWDGDLCDTCKERSKDRECFTEEAWARQCITCDCEFERRRLRVLVACEFSGTVRDAFRRLGHDAVSCDLLASDAGEPHIQGDVRDVLGGGWDVMVAFPPCTHLAVSGARWWADKWREQAEAVCFVRDLWDAPIPRVAVENPIGRLSTVWRRPDQIVQPWMFGHGETKATCLWLRGLPPLLVSLLDQGRYPRVHLESPGPERWKRRSKTYAGLAEAMAVQWGSLEVAA